MSSAVAVTDGTFQKDVLQSSEPVLVDFWATWCQPCRMVAPVVEEIASENTGKLKVLKLDVDQNQNTAMQYGVSSIPTLILFKDGQPVERVVGFSPKERLMGKLTPHLS
ncbi:MAG: thioredoxin [Chloroflexi bacterium]|nr:thioredoxin [Chloroflexota bacterium]